MERERGRRALRGDYVATEVTGREHEDGRSELPFLHLHGKALGPDWGSLTVLQLVIETERSAHFLDAPGQKQARFRLCRPQ